MLRELSAAMLRVSLGVVQGNLSGAGVTGMLNPMYSPLCIAEY